MDEEFGRPAEGQVVLDDGAEAAAQDAVLRVLQVVLEGQTEFFRQVFDDDLRIAHVFAVEGDPGRFAGFGAPGVIEVGFVLDVVHAEERLQFHDVHGRAWTLGVPRKLM